MLIQYYYILLGKLDAIVKHFNLDQNFYIGLSDFEQEGHWKWSSTNYKTGGTMHSGLNQGYMTSLGLHEDCIQVVPNHRTNYTLRIFPCSIPSTIICEKSFYLTKFDANRLPN